MVQRSGDPTLTCHYLAETLWYDGVFMAMLFQSLTVRRRFGSQARLTLNQEPLQSGPASASFLQISVDTVQGTLPAEGTLVPGSDGKHTDRSLRDYSFIDSSVVTRDDVPSLPIAPTPVVAREVGRWATTINTVVSCFFCICEKWFFF